MYKKADADQIKDINLPLRQRTVQGTFLALIPPDRELILPLSAKQNTILKDGLPNPTPDNANYCTSVCGVPFEPVTGWLRTAVRKFCPGLSTRTQDDLAVGINNSLANLKDKGKSDGVIRNAAMRYLCWAKFRVSMPLSQTGKQEVPLVRCSFVGGRLPSDAELTMLSILQGCGCDVLTECQTAEQFNHTRRIISPIPDQFLTRLKTSNASPKGDESPARTINSWFVSDAWRETILARDRNTKNGHRCNIFVIERGVPDLDSYALTLARLKETLEGQGRKVLVLDGKPKRDAVDEFLRPQRCSYLEEAMSCLGNTVLMRIKSKEVWKSLPETFTAVMRNCAAEAEEQGRPRSYAKGKAAYLARNILEISQSLTKSDGVIFQTGDPGQDGWLLLELLAQTGFDVVILDPAKELSSCPNWLGAANVEKNDKLVAFAGFPSGAQKAGTVAYRAEREVHAMMEELPGLRPDRSAQIAPILLETALTEIPILWRAEARFRPGFLSEAGKTEVPVIRGKVLGVEEGDRRRYLKTVREMELEENTIVWRSLPQTAYDSRILDEMPRVIFRGQIDREKVISRPWYRFKILSTNAQETVFDAMDQILTGESLPWVGTRDGKSLFMAVVFSLGTEITRIIQAREPAGPVPKLLVLADGEKQASKEDASVMAFLAACGWDILALVPTGYSTADAFLAPDFFQTHEAGPYMYDIDSNITLPSASGAGEKVLEGARRFASWLPKKAGEVFEQSRRPSPNIYDD